MISARTSAREAKGRPPMKYCWHQRPWQQLKMPTTVAAVEGCLLLHLEQQATFLHSLPTCKAEWRGFVGGNNSPCGPWSNFFLHNSRSATSPPNPKNYNIFQVHQMPMLPSEAFQGYCLNAQFHLLCLLSSPVAWFLGSEGVAKLKLLFPDELVLGAGGAGFYV